MEMAETVIKVENLSKKYFLQHEKTRSRYKSLREEIAFFFKKQKDEETREEFWALNGVNFEINRGDRVGIVGRNGAGKSTLLKILSRIVEPTTGSVGITGRVASLLEVGTGFHPELTGRENIYLNGAILGMSRSEIKSRFDEIVDFAEVEKFLDTPVKRYSSGMYVRLAFSVAAHLEPEILIVDEVLSVGDVEFQKKCLGKMQSVSKGEGRTVLFVSHNLSAVVSLCDKGIYLHKGQVRSIGPSEQIVNSYLSGGGAESGTFRTWETDPPGDSVAKLYSAQLIDEAGQNVQSVMCGQQFGVEFEYEVLKAGYKPVPNIHIFTNHGEIVFVSAADNSEIIKKTGRFKTRVWIPAYLLNERQFVAGVGLTTYAPLIHHFFERDALQFSVIEDMNLRRNDNAQWYQGLVHPELDWAIEQK